ncbi:MAG: SMC-Scp complex subunit ScpB [Deltaproteobacteria bacterium]|nr:SMC-Scp complex subunit ScpB [Deltaproteobacteria bacterium]
MIDKDAVRIVEAILFASPDPVPPKQIAEVLGTGPAGTPSDNDISPRKISGFVDQLNAEYESTGRVFRIVEAGGGFQMRTLPLYKTWIQKLEPLKPVKLTQAALETLAIVAYHQPVIRADIDHLRGVDSSHNLRGLLEKKLIRISGKDTSPGRPILYGTTKTFLSLFNLNDMKDLPTIEDLDLPVLPERVEQLSLEAS